MNVFDKYRIALIILGIIVSLLAFLAYNWQGIYCSLDNSGCNPLYSPLIYFCKEVSFTAVPEGLGWLNNNGPYILNITNIGNRTINGFLIDLFIGNTDSVYSSYKINTSFESNQSFQLDVFENISNGLRNIKITSINIYPKYSKGPGGDYCYEDKFHNVVRLK